tara:strand:- start:386 stop:601 length:216 start_codon:yes stop_codon:yes gene_type:complete
MVKGTRKLSAFNIFMKDELKRVKKSHPKISHKDAFKMAAENWKKHSGAKSKAKSSKNVTRKLRRKRVNKKK